MTDKTDLARTDSSPMAMGGVAPAIACRSLEIAIRKWQAIKYGFHHMDEDGGTVFQIHPRDWEEGDYDFSIRWYEWYTQDHDLRYVHDLKTWVEEARDRKVDTLVLNAMFKVKKKVPWYMWGGAIAGGALFLKYLFEPPKPIHVEGLPTIDTKPIEDIFQELAGEQAKPAIKYDMTPVGSVAIDVNEKKDK